MCSKTLVCIEVEAADGRLVVRGLGAGARDWFAGAPWQVGDGTLLRDLLHVDDWSALEELNDSLHKAGKTASTAAWLAKVHLNVTISHFKACKYQAEHMDMHMHTCIASGASFQTRVVETVEYVPAKLQVASLPPVRSLTPKTPEAADSTAGAAPWCSKSVAPRAVLIFNLPEEWQRTDTGAEAGAHVVVADGAASVAGSAGRCGSWQHVDDSAQDGRCRLEDIVGLSHEYMGVFKLDRLKCKGIEHMQSLDAAGEVAWGLSGIVKMLCDPVALLDDADKATMQRVVASLGSQGHASEYSVARYVSECIELHSGIASSNDADSLALFYRLKLPNTHGGYETPWKPLRLYNLNTYTVRHACCLHLHMISGHGRLDVWRPALDVCGALCLGPVCGQPAGLEQ